MGIDQLYMALSKYEDYEFPNKYMMGQIRLSIAYGWDYTDVGA